MMALDHSAWGKSVKMVFSVLQRVNGTSFQLARQDFVNLF